MNIMKAFSITESVAQSFKRRIYDFFCVIVYYDLQIFDFIRSN